MEARSQGAGRTALMGVAVVCVVLAQLGAAHCDDSFEWDRSDGDFQGLEPFRAYYEEPPVLFGDTWEGLNECDNGVMSVRPVGYAGWGGGAAGCVQTIGLMDDFTVTTPGTYEATLHGTWHVTHWVGKSNAGGVALDALRYELRGQLGLSGFHEIVYDRPPSIIQLGAQALECFYNLVSYYFGAPAPLDDLVKLKTYLDWVTPSGFGSGEFTVTIRSHLDAGPQFWSLQSRAIMALSNFGISAEFGQQLFEVTLEDVTVELVDAAPAELVGDKSLLDFGSRNLGQTRTLGVEVTNRGAMTANVAASIEGDGFSVAADDQSFALAHAQSRTVDVTFEPQEHGFHGAVLTLSGGVEPIDVSLQGMGVNPFLGHNIKLEVFAHPGNEYVAGETVGWRVHVHNTGDYQTGDIDVGFIATGPGDYSDEQTIELSPLNPNQTTDGHIYWDIPSGAQAGVYRFVFQAANEKGDEDSADNRAVRQIRIGPRAELTCAKVVCDAVICDLDEDWDYPGHDPAIPRQSAWVGEFDIGNDHYQAVVGIEWVNEGVALDIYKNGQLMYVGVQADPFDSIKLSYERSHHFADSEYGLLVFGEICKVSISGGFRFMITTVAVPNDAALPAVTDQTPFYEDETGELVVAVPTSKYAAPECYATTSADVPQVLWQQPIGWVSPANNDHLTQEVSEITFEVVPPSVGSFDFMLVLRPMPSGQPTAYYLFHSIYANPAEGYLQVTLEPAEAVQDGARWRVDGGDWQESGETVGPLDVGLHTVSYLAIEHWDEPASEQVEVHNQKTTPWTASYTLTNEPPSITGVSIAPHPACSGDPLTAEPSGWDDPDGDPEGYQWQWYVNDQPVQGGTAPTLGGGCFGAGDHVKVQCTPWDGIAQGPAVTDEITIANARPTTAITAPADGATVYDASVLIQGTASDDVGLEKVIVRVNSGAWFRADGTENWSAWADISPGGPNLVEACARDSAGQWGAIVGITLNGAANLRPVARCTSPAQGDTVYDAWVRLQGIAVDDTGVAKVIVRVNSGPWMCASGTTDWSAMANIVPGATNLVEACALDIDAQWGPIVGISFDVVPNPRPVAMFTSPPDGATVNDAGVLVQGTAVDDVGLDKVIVRVNGGPWTRAEGTADWSAWVNMSPGANSVEALARDVDGQWGPRVTMALDGAGNLRPVAMFTSPPDGATVYDAAVLVQGTAVDDVGLDKVIVRVNGGAWVRAVGTTAWSARMNITPDGANLVEACARDGSGQWGPMVAMTLNAPANLRPVALITLPGDGDNVAEPQVTVTGTATDDDTVVKVIVRVNGGAWAQATGTTNWNRLVDLLIGPNLIEAVAYDDVGLWGPYASVTMNRVAAAAPAAVTASVLAAPTSTGAEVCVTLSAEAAVTAEVLNIAGLPVRVIVQDRPMPAGSTTVAWNGRSQNGLAVPSGAYLVRITARTEDGGETSRITPLLLRR